MSSEEEKMTLARNYSNVLSRRSLIGKLGCDALAMGAAGGLPRIGVADGENYQPASSRVKQSVVHWCYKPMPVEDLAAEAVKRGLQSVELVPPEYWPLLKRLNLICAMAPSHGFAKGFAQRDEHAECLGVLRQRIDDCAAAGFPNVITFSGYRRGLSDETALTSMVDGLKQVVGHAERKNVTVCLEMLNSRVHVEMKGHPDYFCDHLETALEVCRRIGSERMKILFDIYHVQIMEGDLVTRINECHP